MHLLELSHTSHTRVQTGIQVVCRALYAELAKRQAARPITWDPYAKAWRQLQAWECANLELRSEAQGDQKHASPRPKRGAQWPLHARLCGRWQALRHKLAGGQSLAPECERELAHVVGGSETGTSSSSGAGASGIVATGHAAIGGAAVRSRQRGGLIVPEIFPSSRAAHYERLTLHGPRVALFHDAIALKSPELSAAKTVAAFPRYLHALLGFDGIAAISEDSAQTLRDYFLWLGAARLPQIRAIPLGVRLPETPHMEAPATHSAVERASEEHSAVRVPHSAASAAPTILSVGSIEGRKNHSALLDAAEALWARGRVFRLHIIGLAQSETGRAALQKINALQAAGRPLYYAGHASRAAVEAAYASCAFTVYPSIVEGFGLPVIESLARGRPCICSGRGALGEVARGGGALMLDEMSAPALAAAIDQLLQAPEQLTALAGEARARHFRTWSDYADELLAWMDTLPGRSTSVLPGGSARPLGQV